AVRFKISWKRSGILLIHSGLVVIMLSELITGLFAVESRMTIEENHSMNYVEDNRVCELAIVDRSDRKLDDVVVVPGSVLRESKRNKRPVRNEELPFDIEVVDYMVNSSPPEEPAEGAHNRATAGDGRLVMARERPEVSGTESEVDVPSAYLTFKDKETGRSLGTYLVSVWWSAMADRPQR